MHPQPIRIVGAGLAGPLCAILLARRNFQVTLYERRGDPRVSPAEAGRSINLALAARGIRVLERVGLMERIRPLMITMRGRMVHETGQPARLQPYGQRPQEVIYSVGRAALNRVLIEEAARHPSAELRFDQACESVDTARNVMMLRDVPSGRAYEMPLSPTIAADGASSSVRSSLATSGALAVREDEQDHDYKELAIPPAGGSHVHVLEREALHVWPRHGFMLIALPNTDGSFTATLFYPRSGLSSFASLVGERAIEDLFAREFPDVRPHIPDLARQFREHPQGRLRTVHAWPWHTAGQALLLGDAAHAIVPFHGQGMNAAFEDCSLFDALLDRHEHWPELYAAFEAERRPDAEAIAAMAVENYGEMRERVLDPRFLRLKTWALELERRFPGRFIPRYSMVMFHPEIPYREALRRGKVQQEILDELDRAPDSRGAGDAGNPGSAGNAGGTRPFDAALAERLIAERL